MTTIEAVLPGIYARSEPLVQATRDHDRKRITDAELGAAQRRDVEDLLGVQVAAGVSPLTDGLLDWHDLFRPLSGFAEGVKPGPLTRFRDTNTFYRQPLIDASASVSNERVAPFFTTHFHVPRGPAGLLTLPSPLSLAAGAIDTTPAPAAIERAARLVEPLARAGANHGISTIVLDEPFAEAGDEAAYKALGRALSAWSSRPPLWLRLPFVDAAPLWSRVGGLPVAGTIVDLVQTDLDALPPRGAISGLGLGIVDARSSLVETPEDLVEAAILAESRFRPARLLLAPNGDLQHVPEAIARRKVRALGEATRWLRVKIGGGA